jgi:hypothetical protein
LPARNIKFFVGLIAGVGLFPFDAEACSGIGIGRRLAAICNLHAVNTTPQTLQSLAHTHQALTRIGFRDGIQLFPAGKSLNLQIAASPKLSFSENINGGLPDRTLEVAGLRFSPNEDRIRQSGWLFGFELGAYGTYSLGRGSYLDFQAAASTQRANDYDLTIDRFTISGCGHFHLGNWRYIDICRNQRIEEKDLLTGRLTEESLSLSQFWSSGSLSYRLSGEVSLISSQSGEPNAGFALESELIGFDGRTLGMLLELTNKDLAINRPDYQARIWLGGNLRERPSQAFADIRSTYEGEVLGVSRVDRTARLGVAYVPHPSLIVSLGVKSVESSIDYFSKTSPFVSLHYQALTFSTRLQ